MKSLSILLADDEETICALIQKWLTTAGHAVVTVGSAEEARRLMRDQRFDLVITDVLMPDGDGLDLITELRKAQPKTRILAMSGGGRYVEGDDCLRMARGLGAHATVMKPFKWEQLEAAMNQALAPPAAASW